MAQDTTAYGMDQTGKSRLPELLRKLARIRGLRWLRLMYAHPANLTEETLAVMAEEKKICRYIDVPFQHVSSRILKLMGRPGSRQGLEKLVQKVRQFLPQAAIRSSFIVGFPGETEQEHQEMLDFLKQNRLNWVGFFPFFAEKGSAASRLGRQVPAKVKQERFKKAYNLQKKITKSLNESWLGKKLQVLVENYDVKVKSGRGRSFREAPEIDGSVLFKTVGTKTSPQPGRFIPVTITGVSGYDLVGRCLE